ncbi:MAG: ABC transporter ATP-binding protein, partial [Chloroflexota bacterium]
MRFFLWRARAYYRQVAGLLVIGSICGILMNTSVVLPAVLLGRAIDLALALERAAPTWGEGVQAALTRAALVRAAVIYFLGTSVFFVARVGKRWWLRTAMRRVGASVQSDALRGVLAWPMADLHRQAVGDLMARIVSDTQVFLSGFNEATTELWDTWLFSISLIVAMLAYNVHLTIMVMLLVPAAFAFSYYSRSWVRGRTQATRVATAVLTTALQEYLSGVRVLRLFGRAQHSVERVDALSATLERAAVAETRLQAALQLVYTFMITSGVVLLVWLGGRLVLSGALTVGALVAFTQLYLRFTGRGYRLPLFFNRLQAAEVAWERLEPLLAQVYRGREPRGSSFVPGHMVGLAETPRPTPPMGSGPLAARLEGVSLRYPGAAHLALSDVSVDVPAGSLVAITGPVGAGKSALLRALLGLYPVEAGQVWVDGRPAADMPPAERALRVGYVPQDPALFAGTVLENIRMGADGADDGVARVVEIAQLAPDLAHFPAGLATEVGEGGVQVSGGQR